MPILASSLRAIDMILMTGSYAGRIRAGCYRTHIWMAALSVRYGNDVIQSVISSALLAPLL